MPEGQVLEFTHVTKRFNEVTAVSDFSARVEPGAVTAFLGPNGAGKTTTLRILLGQVRATSGTATIGGTTYAELRQPLRTIGAVLEETVYRPRRTAERQLTIAAKANGIPLARVGEVLSLVGLEGEGDSRIGGFSLGMRQRLSVANALLGDPGALVFDEPANGLDPEGIRWMRLLMRRLADEGRTVLVSSHVLSEVEQVADNVLVLSKGTLVLASGIETLADPKGGSVIVDAADRAGLTSALAAAGFDIEVLRSGLTVRGGDAETVGAVAADAGIALSTLVQRGPTLEDVFIDLMRGGRFAPSAPATATPLVAPNTPEIAPEESTPAEAAPEEASPAPADSVVAIPVAAAAAWAAEAASAPAGEAVASNLAASVGADASDVSDASEASVAESAESAADESSADVDSTDTIATGESTSEEETPAEDAPDEEDSVEETPGEEASIGESGDVASGPFEVGDAPTLGEQSTDEQAPARSFDEILFGAAVPADTADTTPSDLTSGDEDHSGVEIFADLDDASVATESDALSSHSDGPSSADTEDTSSSDDDEEDPRSAAVSSMLAAAARAYYEDEPKDYPLGAEDEPAQGEASDSEAADSEAADGEVADGEVADVDTPEAPAENAHWSVASTGVIDTVPLAEGSAGGDETTPDDSDENTRENHDGENHDGENHDGENHDGENQHGDHQHG
ncbi:ATP-binding cassette domain-containing protein [Microbacterium sp. STF-2]|uniref:ATP-binding cassette domain-containing protein n=1 Tax=Microbacterium sp. STF-2 TaxID=3031132 RepID=UPI002AFEAE90|nr:ATP-binding cassette domain-containing protein [Microbacterium sp. STF-2]MEA1263314.1 ATP-binding cassette domain-containing protein [Microbacterium sp. STF-2]